MRRILLLAVFLFAIEDLYAPPNCEIYRDDKNCYQSCNSALRAIRYQQGSWQSQKHFDKSIAKCSTFAYSYMEKAVPYLKRGDFIGWKELIDKAVELSAEEYLGYRGWCRLQFLRDYRGAIQDIEELLSLVTYDIGYCQTGDYHLEIALALCYKETGDNKKAEELILTKLEEDDYHLGFYDYYHLGVIQYEQGKYEEAIISFQRQIEVNDYLAETYYYLALAYQANSDQERYEINLEKAEKYYLEGKYRTDGYCRPVDKIYLADIEKEKRQPTQQHRPAR